MEEIENNICKSLACRTQGVDVFPCDDLNFKLKCRNKESEGVVI